MRDAIDRVGQDVDYFEIWNEPNAGDRPISASLYDQLAAVAIDDIVDGRPLWITEIGPADGTWDEAESNSFFEGLIYEMDLMNVDQFVWWHLFSDGDQATSFPESDLLEVTASLVFQGKNAAFYTFQGAASVPVTGPAALLETVESYKTVTEYWTQNTHYFNNSGGLPFPAF